MTKHHKEGRGVLIYAFVFFLLLAISSFLLLDQLQQSSQTAVEFFEPVTISPESLFK